MRNSVAGERSGSRPRVMPSREPSAVDVVVSAAALTVTLKDGRTISLPIAWYPRLAHGTRAERNHWELTGDGTAIHWPDLNEDLSVESLLAGRPSMESAKSIQRWLD